MPKTIMISDDAMFMRTMLKTILANNGYTVIAEASNGEEAVRLYQEHKPDLVLMDITMPVMDGIAAVKQIRTLDGSAKIVMCTAMGRKDMVVEAIRAGAKDFIIKPFQPDRVIQSVEKIIGKAA